jgi:hypothetical protein
MLLMQVLFFFSSQEWIIRATWAVEETMVVADMITIVEEDSIVAAAAVARQRLEGRTMNKLSFQSLLA